MSEHSAVTLRLASTVMILRQAQAGMEVLLLRRNAQLAFAGGAWVFPGGAVDQADAEGGDEGSGGEEFTARIAAVRECQEECGLTLQPEQLVHFAHWTTPEDQKRRFATWFFVAAVPEQQSEVVIDDGEIHEFQWLSPGHALARHRDGELSMMPPTYMSLKLLQGFSNAAEALSGLRDSEAFSVTPRVAREGETFVLLYPGDAGYELRDGNLSGPRHRCVIGDQGTDYIHSGNDVGVAAMDRAEKASRG